MKVKLQTVNIPKNLQIIIKENNNLFIENIETKINLLISVPVFFNYNFNENFIEFSIKNEFLKYPAAKMLLYTFRSKFEHQINGISICYRGTINIQGLGYSVHITKLANGKYSLFFRFGFKDKCTYIMPNNIYIENVETAKTKIILLCNSLELLKQVQIQIQNLRRPKAYKLQGIYLNDIFPKIKKFVK